MSEIVVLGAGPAGCSAAVQCRRLGFDVRLLDKSGTAGGLIREARLVENYPGLEKPLSGKRFAARFAEHLERFDITVERTVVDSVGTTGRQFTVRCDGSAVAATSVIVATGTVPGRLDLPGIGPSGIKRSVLDLPDPLPATVVIVGAGEAAFDYALNVADRGSNAIILARGPSARATGSVKKQAQTHERVTIMYNAVPVSVTDVGAIVVESTQGRYLFENAGGIVLAATGREPVMPQMPNGFEPQISGVRTSIPGLFLAGDAWFGCTGQAGTAVGQGLLAAKYAQEYLRSI